MLGSLSHGAQRLNRSRLVCEALERTFGRSRRGETLTDKDRRVHEQGLVSVLRQIHDDLAYGWPADPSASSGRRLGDDEILRRLVALNAERAAEERRGLVRWLRPDFQNPGGPAAATESTQGELALADPPPPRPSPARSPPGPSPSPSKPPPSAPPWPAVPPRRPTTSPATTAAPAPTAWPSCWRRSPCSGRPAPLATAASRLNYPPSTARVFGQAGTPDQGLRTRPTTCCGGRNLFTDKYVFC